MNFNAEINVVDNAIIKTKGLFNKNAVRNAQIKFGDFAAFAERTLTNLEDTVASQSAQITKLTKDGESAKKALSTANAELAYKKTEISENNKTIESQAKKIARAMQRIPKQSINLENGNTLEREVKWNGTELQIERTPHGRKVKYNVISADEKTQRGGTFDELTQRRLSTTTKNQNGETTIIYDLNGKTEEIIAGEINLPKVVSSTIEETKHGGKILTEKFSDGTTVVTRTCGDWGRIEKFDINGKTTEFIEECKEGVFKKATYHYKYKNGMVNSLEKTLTNKILANNITEKYNKIFGRDLNGRMFLSEGSVETKFAKVKGKVTKIDKFGALEEFSFKADINPEETIYGKNLKSAEGTCRIVMDSNAYKLIPQNIKISLANGMKYDLKYLHNGNIDRIICKDRECSFDRNLTAIVDNLKLNELFSVG